MTEAEWIASTDPQPMLEDLRGTASARKLRLFVCACYRKAHGQVWSVSPLPPALTVAERFAEGQQGESDLWAAGSRLGGMGGYHAVSVLNSLQHCLIELNEQSTAESAAKLMTMFASLVSEESGATDLVRKSAANAERQHSAALLRCVFGNPFRPVAFDPRWRTETAVAHAAGVYDGRHFDRLPILADALEDAGCDHADLLAHMRGPGPLARPTKKVCPRSP